MNFNLCYIEILKKYNMFWPKEQCPSACGAGFHIQRTSRSESLGGSKVDSVFHPSEVDQVSTTISYEPTQPVIRCSKLTIETLEQGVKYVQSNNKDTRTTQMASFWCLLLILNVFHTLF